MRYLGAGIAPEVGQVRMDIVQAQKTEAFLNQIVSSPLLIVQKIHAIKTFLPPSIDFLLLNGEVGIK
jgi:hypothetical protein